MKKFLHSKQQFPFFKDVSKIAQNQLKPRHDGTENKSSLRKGTHKIGCDTENIHCLPKPATGKFKSTDTSGLVDNLNKR